MKSIMVIIRNMRRNEKNQNWWHFQKKNEKKTYIYNDKLKLKDKY